MSNNNAPDVVHVKLTEGYAHNWWGIVTDCVDEDGVEYVRADLRPAPAVPDDVAGLAADCRIAAEVLRDGGAFLTCQGILRQSADTIEAQAAELARLRQEAARIADDYHPERGQEALALSEMREAIAALTHPTGEPT